MVLKILRIKLQNSEILYKFKYTQKNGYYLTKWSFFEWFSFGLIHVYLRNKIRTASRNILRTVLFKSVKHLSNLIKTEQFFAINA